MGDRNKCHYCRCLLTDKNRTRDHQVPKSKGGNGRLNYIYACFKCNNERGDMDYELFVSRRKYRPLGIKKPDGTILRPKRNLL